MADAAQPLCPEDARVAYLAGLIRELRNAQMATKAEIQAALTELQSVVTGRVALIGDQLSSLRVAFDAFRAEDTTEDAAYERRIAALQAQLDEMTAATDEALAAIRATTAGLSA